MIVNVTSRIPRHVQAATELKRRIDRGEYIADGHLPSVRQLGAELGVSHNAVQRAIQLLQREGLVSSEHGVGVRILARQRQQTLPLRFGMVHPYQAGSLFAGSIYGYIDRSIEIAEHHCIVKSSSQDPARERQIIQGFVETGIEGLLVWPCGGHSNADFFAEVAQYTPIVLVDRHLPEIPVPAVTLDWSGIGRDIALRLGSQGFRKVLILEDPLEVSSYQELYGAMKSTVAATNNQLRFDFAPVRCAEFVEGYPDHPEESAQRATEQLSALLAAEGYDAMFCPSDEYLDTVLASSQLNQAYPDLRLFSITNTLPTPRSLAFYRRNVFEWVCDFAAMFSEATSLLHDKVHLKSRQQRQSHVKFYTIIRSAQGVPSRTGAQL